MSRAVAGALRLPPFPEPPPEKLGVSRARGVVGFPDLPPPRTPPATRCRGVVSWTPFWRIEAGALEGGGQGARGAGAGAAKRPPPPEKDERRFSTPCMHPHRGYARAGPGERSYALFRGTSLIRKRSPPSWQDVHIREFTEKFVNSRKVDFRDFTEKSVNSRIVSPGSWGHCRDLQIGVKDSWF